MDIAPTRPDRRGLRRLVSVTAFLALAAGIAVGPLAGAAPAPPGPWKRAASNLDMVVYYPTAAQGLKLGFVRRIVDPYCRDLTWESLRGLYTVKGKPTRTIEIFEGSPRYCNGSSLRNLPGGESVTIHGRTGTLVSVCGRRDCSFKEGSWGLEWCERGTTVQLIADGLTKTRLVALARSTRPVDRAKPGRCEPVN